MNYEQQNASVSSIKRLDRTYYELKLVCILNLNGSLHLDSLVYMRYINLWN